MFPPERMAPISGFFRDNEGDYTLTFDPGIYSQNPDTGQNLQYHQHTPSSVVERSFVIGAHRVTRHPRPGELL
jgi:hypothetical protein